MKNSPKIQKLILVLIGILISQIIFGQKNYLSGYIINLKEDTIKGFIDYRNWEKNPHTISFRKEAGGEKVIYSPLDITMFGVKDEIYVGAVVKAETSPIKINSLKPSSKLRTKLDTTFLQVLVRGQKSLYLNRNYGKEHFYIKQGSNYKLLKYKRYLIQNQVRENNSYIGQLRIYLSDCPNIQSKLRNTKYNKNDLMDLFHSYYNNSSFKMDYEKEIEKLSLEFGVLAGVSISHLQFNSLLDDWYYLTDIDYPESTNLSAGLNLNIVLPRNQRKWSIYNEIIYTRFKTEGRFEEFKNENSYKMIITKFGFAYLKMNNMLRYSYPIGGKLSIYFNAGMSNGFKIAEENYKLRVKKLFSQERISESKAISATKYYEQGFIFGLGIEYGKFSLETRYEGGDGMSNIVPLGSSTNRYYCLIGYRF